MFAAFTSKLHGGNGENREGESGFCCFQGVSCSLTFRDANEQILRCHMIFEGADHE